MANAQETYAHIRAAVALIMQDLNDSPDATSLEERIHVRMWPHVTHAVRELDPSALDTEAPRRDARSKAWEYVVRFWHVTDLGNDLLAETDPPEIMQGTGALPAIIAKYGREMHQPEGEEPGVSDWLPPELSEKAIKEKLPQLRNNLGRQGSAVLRIPYSVGQEFYLCNVDVKALNG